MIDKLISTLHSFCNGEIYEQGTFAADKEYPPKFITYSFASNGCYYFDNEEVGSSWSGAVIFYSSDYAEIINEPPKIRAALRAAGFIIKGKGAPVPSSRPSHDGWALDFDFIEMEAQK